MVNKIGLLCWIETFPFFAKTRTQYFPKKCVHSTGPGKSAAKSLVFPQQNKEAFLSSFRFKNQPFSFFLFATLGWPSIACVAIKVPINIFSSSEFLKQRGRRKKLSLKEKTLSPGIRVMSFEGDPSPPSLSVCVGKETRKICPHLWGKRFQFHLLLRGKYYKIIQQMVVVKTCFHFFLLDHRVKTPLNFGIKSPTDWKPLLSPCGALAYSERRRRKLS